MKIQKTNEKLTINSIRPWAQRNSFKYKTTMRVTRFVNNIKNYSSFCYLELIKIYLS